MDHLYKQKGSLARLERGHIPPHLERKHERVPPHIRRNDDPLHDNDDSLQRITLHIKHGDEPHHTEAHQNSFHDGHCIEHEYSM